jgi:ectoine hydroxylase-related dioxygenase (phytanoyl-CoA dioxygenase family)
MNQLDNEFKEVGFKKLNNNISLSHVNDLNNEIANLMGLGNIDIYFDRNGKPRRAECFTFKSRIMQSFNFMIMEMLKELTNVNYILFKDKINFKPPGGEGFFPHYDGVFQFNNNGFIKNGWYEYADKFINVLIALDSFSLANGCIEVAAEHKGNFYDLFENTKKNGSPDLLDTIINKCDFVPLILEKGDVVIFSNACPHKSGPNNSNYSRGSLYLTYHEEKFGNNYNNYFNDKKISNNEFKSLKGDR